MSHRRILLLVLSAVLAACEANSHDDDDDPPPPAVQPAAQPTLPAQQPAQPTQQPVAAPNALPAPAPPAALPSAPPAAPQLLGAYEMVWRQDNPTSQQVQYPEALLSPRPGCIWGRWGWTFAENGGLTISMEMLCEAPPELGVGHGTCRAEFTTSAQWRQGGFTVPAPVRADGNFQNFRRQGNTTTFDIGTVQCHVSIGALNATLTEPVPGPGPSRPQEVTLVLADGARVHLRAVESEVNYLRIIDEAARR